MSNKEERLKLAIRDVLAGKSQAGAARDHDVNRGTLRNRILGV